MKTNFFFKWILGIVLLFTASFTVLLYSMGIKGDMDASIYVLISIPILIISLFIILLLGMKDFNKTDLEKHIYDENNTTEDKNKNNEMEKSNNQIISEIKSKENDLKIESERIKELKTLIEEENKLKPNFEGQLSDINKQILEVLKETGSINNEEKILEELKKKIFSSKEEEKIKESILEELKKTISNFQEEKKDKESILNEFKSQRTKLENRLEVINNNRNALIKKLIDKLN